MFQKLKIREAVSALLQDIEKDGIKALLKFLASLVWITYGVPIAAIVSFLVGVSYWLIIPITMPVSLVVMFLGFLLVIFLRLRRLEANLKLPKSKRAVLDGLVYELTEDGSLSGPLCVRCDAKMAVVYDQNENVTRVIFGKQAIYRFICTCGHQKDANKPPSEFLEDAQKYFQVNKPE